MSGVPDTDPSPEAGDGDIEEFGVDIDDFAAGPAADDAEGWAAEPRFNWRIPEPWRASVFGVVAVTALAVLAGWLGLRDHHSQRTQAERPPFLQAAEQGAVNLTTVDWHDAEADARRISVGATGDFQDSFTRRSGSFIDEVKKTQAKMVGTIVRSGLESETPNSAEALVLISVQTTKAIAPEPETRIWRMRISVRKVGDDIKVANVGFVP
jgi:Mce-associated membrane protein